MDTTSSTAPAPASLAAAARRWPGSSADWAYAARATSHLVLDLPIAIAGFVVTVTLGALAAGLLMSIRWRCRC